jgi:hypothetical protein
MVVGSAMVLMSSPPTANDIFSPYVPDDLKARMDEAGQAVNRPAMTE